MSASEPHRNAELEAQIVASPRAREPYLVYRDWLEAQGFVEDGRVSLGQLAAWEAQFHRQFEWQHGFIRSCVLWSRSSEIELARALECLLDDPGPARFAERLELCVANYVESDYADVCRVIARRPRPTLTALALGDRKYTDLIPYYSTIGDIATIWPALMNLRELTLKSRVIRLDGVNLPELRSLELGLLQRPEAVIRPLAAASWPRLTDLSLRLGPEVDTTLLELLLGAGGFVALERLELRDDDYLEAVCERLPDAPLLARLRSLALTGRMTSAGVDALVQRRDAFAHLERLVLGETLSPALRERLAVLGPALELTRGETA